jgi:predicted neuraminidase
MHRLLRAGFLALGCLVSSLVGVASEAGGPRKTDLFPPERWHNHGSCIVQLPDGQFLAVWFHGSGERKADDVLIEGARCIRGRWTPRMTMADTPGYPDTNPSLFLDARQRLWLVYPTILANLWESALLKAHVSTAYSGKGVPRWDKQEVLHVTPGPEFDKEVASTLPMLASTAARQGDAWTPDTRREVREYLDAFQLHSTNRLYRRLGWMTRAHPQLLPSGRILMPLYHDGFSASLVARSDDHGVTWTTSNPLIGGGNIQPSIVRGSSGQLVAYMRDNGPPPKRLLQSTSTDDGATWGPVTDSAIPNPGSGAEVIRLQDGSWLFVGNDTEEGRHRLSLWLSRDDGRTWPVRRVLEESSGDSFSYPSILQARDGRIHATYSAATKAGETIRHADVPLAWLKDGAPSPGR